MSPCGVEKVLATKTEVTNKWSDDSEENRLWEELAGVVATFFDDENINRIGARRKTLLDTDKDSSDGDKVERFWIGDENVWARRETQQNLWKDKDEHDNQLYGQQPPHLASIVRMLANGSHPSFNAMGNNCGSIHRKN